MLLMFCNNANNLRATLRYSRLIFLTKRCSKQLLVTRNLAIANMSHSSDCRN